jgi:hypothetical protein
MRREGGRLKAGGLQHKVCKHVCSHLIEALIHVLKLIRGFLVEMDGDRILATLYS